MTSVKALETAMPRPGPVNPSPRPAASAVLLLVATRKGAWLLHGDAARRRWRLDGPHFHGHSISHLVLDPRDGRTLLAAAKTGHLGPTIFRSTDLGRTWKEASRPPASTLRSCAASVRLAEVIKVCVSSRTITFACRHPRGPCPGSSARRS